MSDVLRFDGVWKRFRRGVPHGSLREAIPALAWRALGRPRASRPDAQMFWALEDVSFEVHPGEVFGIIGPNGAGKSTVLKLACGIVAPDRGDVRVRGRIGALIELAAGFHPDLTGRENVFLQGALLGMKRPEILRQFDRIVEFAGVEEFIDTQVKRYSSGMNARLGFAIAAHMDPDVLLVDEVLSVGDYAFQRKAVDRLREIVGRGIPVILVSHQLDRIASLCGRAALLSRGRVVRAGSAGECVAAYVDGEHLASGWEGSPPVWVDAVQLGPVATVRAGERLLARVTGEVLGGADAREMTVGIWVRSLPGEEVVFATGTAVPGVEVPERGPFEHEFDLQMNTGPGVYRLQAFVWHRSEQRELTRGGSALVTVEPATGAWGRAYLDPRVRRRRP